MSSDLKSAEALTAEAFEALENGDLKCALKLGRRLEKMRYSAAFEIQALVYAGQGKPEKAIGVLEQGLKKAPQVWLLWQLLGNYRSDQALWEESFRCYREALACPTVDASSVHLNQAIALGRCGRYEEALNTLDLVTSPDLRRRVASQRLAMLNAAERFTESISLGESLLATDTGECSDTAGIHSELAFAYWKGKANGEAALTYAWNALALDKKDETAAWVVREAENLYTPDAHHLHVIVHGLWPEPIEGDAEAPGFFVTYQVVADTADEALDFIRRFEPEDVRDSLTIHEAELMEPANLPKGVYEISGYFFYPWEA